jgi:hypothetical protein
MTCHWACRNMDGSEVHFPGVSRPLAVALPRLTRVPAVCGRCTARVARVRQWVALTGRRAPPADADAGSVWPMHRLRGAGTAVGRAH